MIQLAYVGPWILHFTDSFRLRVKESLFGRDNRTSVWLVL